MNRDEEFLKNEIKRVKLELRDLISRMPPHDPPMSMMMRMDELEVEEDSLKEELKMLQENR